MAEDVLSFAIKQGALPAKPCVSADVPLRGAIVSTEIADPFLREYGTDAAAVQALAVEYPGPIDPALPYTFAQVAYAVREESARTVEDVLSRRTRALLIDARAAIRSAPAVAEVMRRELERTPEWERNQVASFTQLAKKDYLLS